MKKLIAILVVFAVVAGAAFAQDEGSWSISSSGTIGTKLDFTPMEGDPGAGASTGTEGDMRGKLGLTYSRGALSVGLDFQQGQNIGINAGFSGDNFTFKAGGNFQFDVTGRYVEGDPGATPPTTDSYSVSSGPLKVTTGELWGNYIFDVLNGLKLQVAVDQGIGNQYNVTDIFGETFTHHDAKAWNFGTAKNYLWLDVGLMDGLNAGFIIPSVFTGGKLAGENPNAALKRVAFGAKFATGPVGIGLQFALGGSQGVYYNSDGDKVINTSGDLKAGLYLGATYKINDQMSAGLEFRSLFGTGQKTDKDGKYSDAVGIAFGAKFDFSDGPFGAGLTIKFSDNDAGVNDNINFPVLGALEAEASAHNQEFAVSASVRYDLDENYLRFSLGAGFTFIDAIDPYKTADATDGKAVWASVIKYSFTPELNFNFLGTGAGGDSTGIKIKYTVEGPAVYMTPATPPATDHPWYPWSGYFDPTKGRNSNNNLTIVFKWSL